MILYLIILLLAIPTGLLIAWLARDELIDGFVYIKSLLWISFALMIVFSFYNEAATLAFGFITIVSYISILKKHDKKWAVERKR